MISRQGCSFGDSGRDASLRLGNDVTAFSVVYPGRRLSGNRTGVELRETNRSSTIRTFATDHGKFASGRADAFRACVRNGRSCAGFACSGNARFLAVSARTGLTRNDRNGSRVVVGRREESSFRADRRLIRRELVIAALGGLTGAFPARAEEQSGKMSQIAAAYQSTPKGLCSCAVCSFFIRPRSCKVVSGDTNPTGWCKFFDLPD